MYTFDDRGGRSLTLRPEGTAAAVRAYVEHKMFGNPDQPVNYHILDQCFVMNVSKLAVIVNSYNMV